MNLDNEILYKPHLHHPEPWTLPGFSVSYGVGNGAEATCECIVPELTSVQQTSSSAPFTVQLTWSLPEHFCDALFVEIWRSVNGGAYSLWETVAADALSHENNGNNPAGNDGQQIGFKIKVVQADPPLDCDFSNEIVVQLVSD